jgi:hypothetical protein
MHMQLACLMLPADICKHPNVCTKACTVLIGMMYGYAAGVQVSDHTTLLVHTPYTMLHTMPLSISAWTTHMSVIDVRVGSTARFQAHQRM